MFACLLTLICVHRHNSVHGIDVLTICLFVRICVRRLPVSFTCWVTL